MLQVIEKPSEIRHCRLAVGRRPSPGLQVIPPIWFGLAFLRTRLPCSDPTTDDKNSRVELAVGT